VRNIALKSILLLLGITSLTLSSFARSYKQKFLCTRKENGFSSYAYEYMLQFRNGMGKTDSVLVLMNDRTYILLLVTHMTLMR